MLRQFNWDVNRLMDDYFDHKNDADCMEFAGNLSSSFVLAANVIETRHSALFNAAAAAAADIAAVRMICFECAQEKEALEMISLTCGHFACERCWRLYLQQQLSSDSIVVGVACLRSCSDPQVYCDHFIGMDLVEYLLGASAAEKYLQLLVK